MPPDFKSSSAQLDQLRFDPDNPRLPPHLRGVDDSDAVLKWMLADRSLLEIMASIADQGYFPGDPLLVSPHPDPGPAATTAPDPREGGEFLVVEGNRRLASLRLLQEPEAAPRRRAAVEQVAATASAAITEVPVVAFPCRDSILTYLGFRHITGIKEWDPLEKARFLDQLRTRAIEAGQPHDNRTLARQIGSQGPYVGRLLAALHALTWLADTGYFDENEVNVEDVHFSLLSTALNYEDIVTFLGLAAADDPDLTDLNHENLRQLATWLFVERDDHGTALEESRNMRYLAAVAPNPDARAALDGGARVRQAALLAFDADRLFTEAVEQAAPPMEIARAHADDVESPPAAVFEKVVTIGAQADEIQDLLRDRLDGSGSE